MALIFIAFIWTVFFLFFYCILYHFISGKARRLKQAKEEAQQEIEAYKKEREAKFQEIQQKVIFHAWIFRIKL